MNITKKGVISLPILIMAFVVLLGVSGWMYFEQNKESRIKNNEMIDTANWKTYTNSEYGFGLQYPDGWALRDGSSNKIWVFQSATFDKNISGGFDLPPSGNMVVRVFKDVPTTCTSDDYQKISYSGIVDYDVPGNYPPDPHAETLRKVICKDKFKIILELWADDHNLNDHKALLDRVLSTFKFTN